MKKIALILSIISIGSVILSCDKVNDLKTWDLNTGSNISFEVNITANDPTTFSTVFTLSLADNPDIADYINQIKEYKINAVKYQIWSYNSTIENDVLLTGTFKLGSINIFLDKVNLKEMYQMGTTATLDLSDQELIDLAKTLESNKSISGSLAGEVTDKPVYFMVNIEFDLTLRIEQ